MFIAGIWNWVVSKVPSIPNHCVILYGDLEIKNNKNQTSETHLLFLLTPILFVTSIFKTPLPIGSLKSRITIFCQTLSRVRLQNALHRKRVG